MRYLIVTDDCDRETLEEAINNLRARQRVCRIASIRNELDADISELLDLWSQASGPVLTRACTANCGPDCRDCA